MKENIFVRRPIFAMVIAIMIVVLGLISIRSMPIEQYPDITPPMVEVTATYQGADAITVEQSVATPIEESVNGVQGMIYMESTNSGNGMMNLQISFAVGTDPDMNTIFTQNRVASATPQLPSSVITQGVTTQKTMSNAIMVLSVFSDGKYDADFLTNYSIINIKDAISRINGVGSVSVMGAGEYAMRIWLHPDKMSYYGLDATQVMQAVQEQSRLLPGGTFGAAPITSPTSFTYNVLMGRNYNSPADFENVILRSDSKGATVRLKDVASVALGAQTYNVNATYQGHPCAIIMINQAPGSNAVEVGNQVQALMDKISTEFPEGMKYQTIVNLNKTIISGIRDIITTLIIALILVVLVVFVFLQDWRAMIIPLVAIPVSLIGAFMLFPLFGFSINVFSLLGLVLAIGLVVDDAIVVTEAVQVNIEKGQDGKTATINAMKQVTSPIIAMTSVLIAVFLPVALMPGAAGMLYKQFAVTLALTVCISGINSLSLSPALCSLLLKPRADRKQKGLLGRFFGGFNRVFSRSIDGYINRTSVVVRHAGRSLVFIAICAAAILLLFKKIPTGFLPDEDQGYIIANIELPNAASLARTTDVMSRVRELVEQNPNVEATTSAAGFSILGNTQAPNTGVMFIKLKDFSQRKMSSAEISDYLNGVLYEAVNGGEVFTFGPPSIPGLGPSSGFTMMIQDKGGNTPQYLADYTRRFVEAAGKRPEIASVNTMFAADVPQKMIVVDDLRAIGAGISLSELHTQIAAYLGGSYINNFNKFGRSYQTYIQADDRYRTSEKDVDMFHVTTDQGVSVPISSFITIRDTIGPSYTNRFNLYRSAAVSGLPSPKYSTSQCMAALEEVAAEVLPPDMGYTWANLSYQEAKKSGAGAIFIYAIIFVFLILAALYESWSLPISIILGIPFAVLGAMLFIFMGHFIEAKYINDIFVQISLIMLVGLAAKNAILIVAYAKDQFDQGLSLVDAAIAGARLRIRPVLMTAFAFLMGVIPLILASGSNSVARNVMGVALFGGMLVATFIGIFVYPALFVCIGKLARYEKKRGVAGKIGAVVLFALFMGSCAVGPKFHSPQVQVPESYIGDRGDTTSEVDWWTTFGDTTLVRLINQAIAHNRTLAMSVSAIEQARLSLGEARTAYYPSLGYSVSGQYGQETYLGTRSDDAEQSYSIKGSISWELGLFGLVRRQVEAAKNDLYANQMASRGVLLSLTSEVASAYFSYLGYRYAEEASERIYVLQNQIYELQKKSFEAGYSSELNLNQNIISLRQAEASFSQTRQARINATYSLSVLLGQNPSRDIIQNRTLDNIHLPAPLDAGIPADLLNRRPDIMEAYYQCASANAMIGAAQAARLPSIALTGSGGVLSSEIKDLFKSGSWLWMGAGSITGPLFNFGKYRRQVKIAREKSHEATLNYQQCVIEALQDVESSLLGVSESHTRADALRELKNAASKAYELSVQQYNYGQINSFDLMAAQTTLLNAEINYAQSVSNLLSAYTSLYKSLGGSFDLRQLKK